MTNAEIIYYGTALGLKYNEKTNFPDLLEKNTVVFDGCNGQRVLIEGKWSNDEIFRVIGKGLIECGARIKCLQISRVLSPMSDTIDVGNFWHIPS